MFPTVLFTGVAFSFVGILQSLGEFNVPALISVVSNCVIILYYWTLDEKLGVYGLAAAFLVGWLLQALVQLPALRRKGLRYYPDLRGVREAGMRKVFALMLPVMVSTWVQPINLTINSKFGSRLFGGAGVSAIEYATNLYLVIAGVFVLSVTNVIFPKLSRLSAGEETGAFRETLRETMHASLFFILPLMAGLMVVAEPLVSFIYGGGEFDAFSVRITAQGLFWVSLGMVGFGVQNILTRAYFARQEGRIPLLAGAASIGVNILLCALLTQTLEVRGLAIASAAASTVYALLLALPMELRREGVLSGRFLLDGLKMLLATAVMALCAWGALRAVGGFVGGKLGELLALLAAACVGALVYYLAASVLRLPEIALAKELLRGRLKRG